MKYLIHEVIEHICEECGQPIGDHEGAPHVIELGRYYCIDCAVKVGLISPDDWLECNGLMIRYEYAEYKNGYIVAYRRHGKGFSKDLIRLGGK